MSSDEDGPAATNGMPAAEAASVLRPCTRTAPVGVEGVWTPSRPLVERVEQRLPPVVDTALLRLARRLGVQQPPTSSLYRRQYVGFLRDGRRMIYINGVYDETLDPKTRPESNPLSFATGWETHAVRVCDGGAMSWGVEYDPQAGRFGRLYFNDSFAGPMTY